MKKNNKAQNTVRPFSQQINQMRKSKVILINFTKVKPFVEACNEQGIELKKGSTYNDGVIFYEA